MNTALQHAETSPTRVPLLEKPSNSPPHTPIKQVRRKTSFVRMADSSESCSSPHDSIYEAHRFSSTDSEESYHLVERLQMVALRETGEGTTNIETKLPQTSISEHPNANIEFRYGNGTILETITEQKSNATIRSLFHSRSANDLREMKSAPFLVHRKNMLVTKSPGRKQSLSLDDINLINQSYHDACAMIERTARKPPPIHEIYASPKVPLSDPLERPSTPPGVPSWTAAQTPTPIKIYRSHVPGTPNRLQRFLGIEASGVNFSSRVPPPMTARVVSTPATVAGSRVAPRFRPPRSVYGPLDRHPFNNCPVATLPKACSPNKKVRFTPSATARDSAEINLRHAIEATSITALHPLMMLPIPQPGFALTKSKLCTNRRHPLRIKMNVDGSSRKASVTSIAPLMSGALPPASVSTSASPIMGSPGLEISLSGHVSRDKNGSPRKFERFIPCWECLVERATRFWASTTSCLCFICCRFEFDDDSVVYTSGYGFATDSGYFDNYGMDVAGQRRTVLEQTPASML